MRPSILIACIGNIFLGDDGFGVEVARSLLARALPEEVFVRDFGIRGFDLAYALLEPWHTVLMVDAMHRSEAPGTLFVIQPDISETNPLDSEGFNLSPHGMDPVRVLRLAASFGSIQPHVLLVGCEPQDFGDEFEGRIGLSIPVKAAVDAASNLIEELVTTILKQYEVTVELQSM